MQRRLTKAKGILGHLCLAAALLSCRTDGVPADAYLQLTDRAFESMLVEKGVDGKGLVDGRILRADVLATTRLDLTGLGQDAENGMPVDLGDLGFFENITFLKMGGQKRIASVDLSNNLKLDTLQVLPSAISELDLSANLELRFLLFSSSKTDTLNLAGNGKLTHIEIGSTPLRSLVVSPAVERLICGGARIKSLDLSNAPNLTSLTFVGSNLESIDLSSNYRLEFVDLTYNYLKELKLPTAYCRDMVIDELHLEKNRNSLKMVCVCDEYQANANLLRKLYIPVYANYPWEYAWTADASAVFEQCGEAAGQKETTLSKNKGQ
ncbi:hypothetical protein LAG90_18295 [Marinilongibacter aquaticus]|uniref:hypothetical protein n=1 Tax=Marinilongibacter aquaticus TaxID=2975157 RepID=UPI0021BDED15|nr:hypothetical protein [Marinilongibacter aquaticus]UBM58754.1 hypothetical protein LAG90_18295 [Marinilongibacter aquaticus]